MIWAPFTLAASSWQLQLLAFGLVSVSVSVPSQQHESRTQLQLHLTAEVFIFGKTDAKLTLST